MRALEQLRYVVEYPWTRPVELIQAVFSLLWEMSEEPNVVTSACRRLLQRQFHLGELWTLLSLVLSDADLSEGIASTYLMWLEHEEDCELHNEPDTAAPWKGIVLPTALTFDRILLQGGSALSYVPEKMTVVTCELRVLDARLFEVLESEACADLARDFISIRVEPDTRVDLEGEGVLLRAISPRPPASSLLTPFPPRLGK